MIAHVSRLLTTPLLESTGLDLHQAAGVVFVIVSTTDTNKLYIALPQIFPASTAYSMWNSVYKSGVKIGSRMGEAIGLRPSKPTIFAQLSDALSMMITAFSVLLVSLVAHLIYDTSIGAVHDDPVAAMLHAYRNEHVDAVPVAVMSHAYRTGLVLFVSCKVTESFCVVRKDILTPAALVGLLLMTVSLLMPMFWIAHASELSISLDKLLHFMLQSAATVVCVACVWMGLIRSRRSLLQSVLFVLLSLVLMAVTLAGFNWIVSSCLIWLFVRLAFPDLFQTAALPRYPIGIKRMP